MSRAAKQSVAHHRPQETPDWASITRDLAARYNAKVALFWHRFGLGREGGSFLETANFSEASRHDYLKLAIYNPWLFFLHSREPGAFIDGSERLSGKPEELANANPHFGKFYYGWMKPYDAIRGIGAVLFVDRHPKQRWAIGIALLRPDGEVGIGRYSPEEKKRFQGEIAFLCQHIGNHRLVSEWKKIDAARTESYNFPALPGYVVPEQDSYFISTDTVISRLSIPNERWRALLVRLGNAARVSDDGLLEIVEHALDIHRARRSTPEVTGAALPEAVEFTQRVEKNRAPATREAQPVASDEAPAQSWQQKAVGNPRGRKRTEPPPTPEEIREAHRILSLWQRSRHKEASIDPEVLRKARRDVRWVERQRQAEKASPGRI